MLKRIMAALAILLALCGCEKQQEVAPVAVPLPIPVEVEVEKPVVAQQGIFDIVGYCACCTPYAHMNRNEDGQVLTASGEWVEIGQCVAVDPDIIPIGSKVFINGQEYTALDTGVKGYVIDILMNHDEAHNFGCKTMTLVTWVE